MNGWAPMDLSKCIGLCVLWGELAPTSPILPSLSLCCSSQHVDQREKASQVLGVLVGVLLTSGAVPEDTPVLKQAPPTSAASQLTPVTRPGRGSTFLPGNLGGRATQVTPINPLSPAQPNPVGAATFLRLNLLMEVSEAGLGSLPESPECELGSRFAQVDQSSAINQ